MRFKCCLFEDLHERFNRGKKKNRPATSISSAEQPLTNARLNTTPPATSACFASAGFRNLWNKVSGLGFARGRSSRANGSIFISAFHQFCRPNLEGVSDKKILRNLVGFLPTYRLPSLPHYQCITEKRWRNIRSDKLAATHKPKGKITWAGKTAVAFRSWKQTVVIRDPRFLV